MTTTTVDTQINLKSGPVPPELRALRTVLNDLNKAQQRTAEVFGDTAQAANRATRAVGRNASAAKEAVSQWASFTNILKAFVTFEASRAISNMTSAAIQSVVEFQRLESQLTVVEGSSDRASETFERLRQQATGLALTTRELAQAYIQLGNFGLDNSIGAITDFADLATSLGKPLQQVIEAVSDAVTGENERLKELGITAQRRAETTIFTFRGLETEVRNSAQEIAGYIRDIGAVNFDGALEQRLDDIDVATQKFNESLGTAIQNLDQATGFSAGLARNLNALADIINIEQGASGIDKTKSAIDATQGSVDALQSKVKTLYETLESTPSSVGGFFADMITQARIFVGENQLEGITSDLQRLNNQLIGAEALEARDALRKNYIQAIDDLAESSTVATDRVKELVNLTNTISRQTNTIERRTTQDQLKNVIQSIRAEIASGADETEKLTRELEKAEAALLKFNNAQSADIARREQERLLQQARRTAEGFRGELLNAVSDYQRFLTQIPALNADFAGTNLTAAAQQNLRDIFLNFIGDPIIQDGSRRAQEEAAERARRIAEALRIKPNDIDLVAELSRRELTRYYDLISSEIDAGFNEGNPVAQFEDEFIAQRRRFRSQLESVNDELAPELARLQRITQENFLSGFSVDLGNPAVDGLRNIIDAVNELALSSANFNNTQLDEFKVNQLERLINLLDINDATANPEQFLSTFNARLEAIRSIISAGGSGEGAAAIRDLYAEQESLAKLSRDRVLEVIKAADAEELENFKLTQRQKILVAAQTGSELLANFTDNSKKIFNVSKLLDASLAANDLLVGLSDSISKGGFFGFIQGLSQLSTFIGIVNQIRDRQFGDSSVNTPGVPNNIVSNAREAEAPQQNVASNVNVTVLGGILDEGGFTVALANGLKQAVRNDLIRPEDIVVNRSGVIS
ncbi:hypothetical protein AB833_19485 [Chromatiales bacterium (ex Bugula neritina AB1)]|nr:hypothetical protein AB833_19485 [Chromatiales bacterium (ex Bugula neritina AB1)]